MSFALSSSHSSGTASAAIWLQGARASELAQTLQAHGTCTALPSAKPTQDLPDGAPDVLVLDTLVWQAQPLATLRGDTLQAYWQAHGLTAMTTAQTLIKRWLAGSGRGVHRGTLVFAGSVLALQPDLAQPLVSLLQAGLRNVAQALAREFAPQGIHVVYIAAGPHTASPELANLIWHVHRQPPSAWTQELVLQSCPAAPAISSLLV